MEPLKNDEMLTPMPVQWSSDEAEKTFQWMREEMARMFELPAHLRRHPEPRLINEHIRDVNRSTEKFRKMMVDFYTAHTTPCWAAVKRPSLPHNR